MGNVYCAYDPMIDDVVAIKQLHQRYLNNPQIRERFLREGKIISSLHHPAIVPIYDIGEQANNVYFVMPLMEGKSLADQLQQQAPFTHLDIASIIKRIGSALEAIHKQGIIHRDVKPQNILFDRDRKPYLADFSIVKNDGDDFLVKTDLGQLLGTPAYMSPESIGASSEVDHRSDLYSLGVVLFELLIGKPPYSGSDVLAAHLTRSVPQLQMLNPRIAPQWQFVIDKAMHKDPNERYQSGTEFALAIEKTVRDLISASESSSTPVLEKTASRAVPDLLLDNVAPVLPPSSSQEFPLVPIEEEEPIPKWIWAAVGSIVLGVVLAISFITLSDPPPPARTSVVETTLEYTKTSTNTIATISLPPTVRLTDSPPRKRPTTPPRLLECVDAVDYQIVLGQPDYRPARGTAVDMLGSQTIEYKFTVAGSCLVQQSELELIPIKGRLLPEVQLLDLRSNSIEQLSSGEEGILQLVFSNYIDTIGVDQEWQLRIGSVELNTIAPLILNTIDTPWLVNPPTSTPTLTPTIALVSSETPSLIPPTPTETPPPIWPTATTASTPTPTPTPTLTEPTCSQRVLANPDGDEDKDGKLNKHELEDERFDPCNPDSDGDGVLDGQDLVEGPEPKSNTSHPTPRGVTPPPSTLPSNG